MAWKEDETWLPISSAPKDGMIIELLIPCNRDIFSEKQCTDVGYWDKNAGSGHPRLTENGCFRFNGDDGAFDIQPTHWRPLYQYPMSYSLRKYRKQVG